MRKSVGSTAAAAILAGALALGAASPAEASVPDSYRKALATAHDYIRSGDFSKAGLYDQLHSRSGEGFSAKASRYGVNNVHANWKLEARDAAKGYVRSGDFSKQALFDQLTSGAEQFTDSQADYALDHVRVDYNQEALDAARAYNESAQLSGAELYDQLTSAAEQFTDSEANYAIDHL